jgi:hypothetical protein
METINSEIWKDVPTFEGFYFVSSFGRIKNKKGKIKKQFTNNTGYPRVCLSKCGYYRHFLTHVLVAEAFIGSIDEKTVNHKNGIKTDNSISNLEIITMKENIQHAIDNNLYHRKILSEEEKTNILHDFKNGMTLRGIAKKNNLTSHYLNSRMNLFRIKDNKFPIQINSNTYKILKKYSKQNSLLMYIVVDKILNDWIKSNIIK